MHCESKLDWSPRIPHACYHLLFSLEGTQAIGILRYLSKGKDRPLLLTVLITVVSIEFCVSSSCFKCYFVFMEMCICSEGIQLPRNGVVGIYQGITNSCVAVMQGKIVPSMEKK